MVCRIVQVEAGITVVKLNTPWPICCISSVATDE